MKIKLHFVVSIFMVFVSLNSYAQFSTYGIAAYTINESSPHQVYVSQNPNTTGPNTWTYIGDLNNGLNDLPGEARDCIIIGDVLYVVYTGTNPTDSGIYIYDLNNPTAGVQPLGSGLFGTLGDGSTIERVNGIGRSIDNQLYAVSSPSGRPDFIFSFDSDSGTVVPNAFGTGIDHLELVMDPAYSGFTIGTNEDMTFSTCSNELFISSTFWGTGGGDDWIASVNKTNGEVTPIANSNLISDGLAFDVSGNFFTSDGRYFYVVNQTTGTITQIDEVTTTWVDLESLDIVLDGRPIAVDDTLGGVYCPSETIVINALVNDIDYENNIDPSTVEISNLPVGVTAVIDNTTGIITLSAVAGFSGLVSFNYTVKDTVLGGCDTALISNIGTITLEINTGTDTDTDGVSNNCDLDDDNDGITDAVEQCGTPAILDWTASQISTNVSNISTTIGGNPVIINAEVVSSTGTNPSFGGDSYNYSGSVSADAGTALSGNVQLSLYQNSFENKTKVTFNITPHDFGDLNLFISDAEITDFVVYAEDPSATRLATANWNVVSYEQNGTTPASAPNPYTINGTDISFQGSIVAQNDDVMRIKFDTQTLSQATKIIVETTKLDLTSGDNVEFMLTTTCPNIDTDNDNIPDYIDIDSDNDGIPDNVEAQPTVGYIAPSGNGSAMTDTNNNGIDDNYGAGFTSLTDTDNDGTPDYLDLDSDNDGLPDIEENGMPNNTLNSDSDDDGLDDAFEGSNLLDNPDVNDEIDNPSSSILPDTDADISSGGDLDYRDNIDVYYPSATIDFDGIDDYVSIPNLQMSGWNEGTIMAWVKLDPDFSLSGDVLGQNMFRIWIDSSSKVHGYVITNNTNTSYGLSSSFTLPKNEWHHLALVYSGSDKLIKLYVDGEEVDQVSYSNSGTALSTNPSYTNPDFVIGRFERFSNRYFKGSVDEVRVFNKNMTDQQIQQMVYQEIENNGGLVRGTIIPKDIEDLATNNKVLWSTLEGYFPMTNIVNSTTSDMSVNNNTVYLHNITTIQPQTAPMPYQSVADGSWTTESTWLHGDVWDIEDVSNNKDWSIIDIKNNVNASHSPKNIGLFIDANKTFTINGNHQENNSWYLELNGTLDLLNDSQLVQGIYSDLVTSAQGKVLRRQEGQSSVYRYNYWSSPVGTKATTNLIDNNTSSNNPNNTTFTLNMLKDASGNDVQFTNAYDEDGKISSYWLYSYQNGVTYYDWDQLGLSTPLQSGLGYTQKGGGSLSDYIFEGKPNNGTVLLSATDTGGSGSVGGSTKTEYLVGNPYPSAIDAHQFINDNSSVISGEVYLWEQWAGDSHILNAYEGGYATLNLLGGVNAYQFVGLNGANNGSQDGLLTPKRYLPVGQGFMVEVVNNGDIKFNNNQRVFTTEGSGQSVFFKTQNNSSTEQNTTNVFQKIRLEFKTGNDKGRQLLLGFSPNTTDDFDYGYDAKVHETTANDLTMPLNNDQTVIQAFTSITPDKVIDLNFIADGSTSYIIKAIEFENLDNTQEVYLRDNQTGTYHDLTTNQDYSFTSNAGAFNDRFDIVFQSEAAILGVDDFNSDNVSIYFINTQDLLFVKGLEQEVKLVTLYNALGQEVFKTVSVTNSQLKNGLQISNLSSGLYIISIKTENNQTIDKKIIIE
ncbi:LamG-like jellyroll fold domain-containing protein [Olleya sp. R77988]|uniref:LamG-like jellyroll fold domain-containing protein n=1 Tax=Olleya sp. R77988 TaxID=3093875 RepID=UPI0037CB3EE0